MFTAEEFGLPLLRASLQNSSDVSKGVNFAVGGATAIDVGFYERNKLVQFKLLNNSLSVQLGWLEELKPSFCNITKGLRHALQYCFIVLSSYHLHMSSSSIQGAEAASVRPSSSLGSLE